MILPEITSWEYLLVLFCFSVLWFSIGWLLGYAVGRKTPYENTRGFYCEECKRFHEVPHV